MSTPPSEVRLQLRLLRSDDYPAVCDVQRACFPGVPPWSPGAFEQQLRRFPEGQIGIELDGQLVATSSSLIVVGDDWKRTHNFHEVSAGGTIQHHNALGDTLYGIDIAVHPDQRGLRLARRIYDARKELMLRLNLRRMFIAGRLPGLARHPELSAEHYVRQVITKAMVDSTLTVQLANGFHIRRILEDYLPSDEESRGHAVLMEWINPDWVPHASAVRDSARVAAVQYRMRAVSTWEEFARQCSYYADLAADYHCDFLLYPELLTNQLIPLTEPDRPGNRVRALDRFTGAYEALFRDLALRNNVNIIAGTHLHLRGERLYNTAWFFHRDGRVDQQDKLHVTPDEARWWGVSPGDRMELIQSDCGPVAIQVCYDVEFPELARVAKARGANILFVPYNTDLKAGHLRVRTCAHARCIENNLYVVLSGMCGGLPTEGWSEIHYGHSAILTPSDIPFPRDGVGAEASDNIETIVLHDVDFSLLRRMQAQGQVRTWVDRRTDLYTLQWHAEDGELTVE
jgi:predicted amidohydrolase/ribosomal protein S18 acetylase RimI-like enzyme